MSETGDIKSAGIGKGTPGPGRPKGMPNKATSEFRETVRRLLEDNRENVSRWLTLVAEGDGSENGKPNPAKALELLSNLAEFTTPKQSRVEGHVSVAEKSFEEWQKELK